MRQAEYGAQRIASIPRSFVLLFGIVDLGGLAVASRIIVVAGMVATETPSGLIGHRAPGNLTAPKAPATALGGICSGGEVHEVATSTRKGRGNYRSGRRVIVYIERDRSKMGGLERGRSH